MKQFLLVLASVLLIAKINDHLYPVHKTVNQAQQARVEFVAVPMPVATPRPVVKPRTQDTLRVNVTTGRTQLEIKDNDQGVTWVFE